MAKPLFLPEVDPHAFFEKEASIAKMPDDEKNWPAQILSTLHEQLPFLSEFSVNIMIQRMEPEAGFAFGYALILSKSDPTVSTESKNAQNGVRIPLIVADRQLQPFHTFEVNGQVYPLTQERVGAALMNPAMFDGPAKKPSTQKSLVDQLYPPYQQRQGFGMTNTGTNMGGISKVSAIAEEDMTPSQLRRLATLKATQKADAAAGSMTSAEKAEDVVRKSALPVGIGGMAGAVKGGLSAFRASKGDTKARLLQTAGGAGIGAAKGGGFVGGVSAANQAAQESFRAKRDIDRRKMGLKVAHVKEAADIADLAILGAGAGTVALGGYKLHKKHKANQEKAKRLRADLKELEERRSADTTKKAHVKEALARLDFNPSRRIPSNMVMKGSKVRVMPGVTPMSIHFFPVMGTNFVVGVDAGLAKKLGKMKDQNQIRRALIGPMKSEIKAARGKRPSPGMFMLFTKTKGGYKYQTPTPIPGLAA